MNYVLGSGVVGMLALEILGPEWTLLPFGRSRFFSFQCPLDDNYITAHDELDDLINRLTPGGQRRSYSIAYSVGGQLWPRHDAGICGDWLHKVFGADYPRHAVPYWASRLQQPIYDVRSTQLYMALLSKHHRAVDHGLSLGKVTGVGDHTLTVGDRTVEFKRVVSTIPLDALQRLQGTQVTVTSKPSYVLLVKTDDLDFEGHNQLLAADPVLSFYKATHSAPGVYTLHCHEEIPQIGPYLMTILKSFDLLSDTRIDGSIPLGQMPNLNKLREQDVFPVGSYAEWDWCADVGTCALRLLRYRERGEQPRRP